MARKGGKMKNKEKYKDKIIEIAMDGDILAINKDTKQPMSCSVSNCICCLFGTTFGCFEERNKWLNQEVEILDEVEKKYLRAVIRPWKDIFKSAKKRELSHNREAVEIKVTDEYMGYWLIQLPPFKKGAMYQGMEVYKEYTLKELGL